MRQDEFEVWLRTLERAPTRAAAASAIDALRDATNETWLNVSSLRRIQSACQVIGVAAPALSLAPLRVGEAWLLLYDNARRRGHLATLVAHERPTELAVNALMNELERARTGLCTTLGAAFRALPSSVLPRTITVEGVAAPAMLGGDSLGVAACIAWISRALGAAPRSDVAATAAVAPTGSLLPVAHLDEKLRALHEERPDVGTVIVSERQTPIQETYGLRLVLCSRLDDALSRCGLDLARLGSLDHDALERSIEELKRIENQALSTERFLYEAARASTLRLMCETAKLPELAEEALRHAALFALHGGDPEAAERILGQVATEQLGANPELHAWHAVVGASAAIDIVPQEAITRALEAVALCEKVETIRVRKKLRARAVGTYGRALLHSGRAVEAEPHLRDAIELHRECAPKEVPRSMTYLVQCLRMQERQLEGLGICEEGIQALIEGAQPYDQKTALFMQLERGRLLLAVSRLDQAMDAFERAGGSQTEDDAYPRISALRGLAACHRGLGNDKTAATYLEKCVQVAKLKRPPLGSIAARAVLDAMRSTASDAATPLTEIWNGLESSIREGTNSPDVY